MCSRSTSGIVGPVRPSFDARLVNGTFGDPGVLLDLKFERRALLFDIGDVSALPTRMLLRVRDVFVSHTHMDHFAGFDHLLRVCLGRDRGVTLYGPTHFIEQLEHKLAAYTWNLVENYATDFVIGAAELSGNRLALAQFRSRNRFRREPLGERTAPDGLLVQTPAWRVRARALEHHGIDSLAFVFEEGTHINVWKSRLEALGLPTGPWLTRLKELVRAGAPDATPVHIRWRTREGSREQEMPLGNLRSQVLEMAAGQKVCYVTDVADTDANRAALGAFVDHADLLFIEAVFLARDHEHAERKAHLTARAAGEIACAARVRGAVPFHFSTRYLGEEERLRAEFMTAWAGAG